MLLFKHNYTHDMSSFEKSLPKSSECIEMLLPEVALIQLLGSRSEQQDAFVAERMPIGGQEALIIGVADGHDKNGKIAAEAALRTICSHASVTNEIDEPWLKKVFADAHDAVIHECDHEGGTMATVAIFIGDKVWVAWVGDSEARVTRTDGVMHRLTIPHNVRKNYSERHRILAQGAILLDAHQKITEDITRATTMYRNKMIIEFTRALGDSDLGQDFLREPETLCVTPNPDDRFLILASDGFWNLLDNTSKRHIIEHILQNAKTTKEARDQIREALSFWKVFDNTTILIAMMKK